jgi:hypothetical protein
VFFFKKDIIFAVQVSFWFRFGFGARYFDRPSRSTCTAVKTEHFHTYMIPVMIGNVEDQHLQE